MPNRDFIRLRFTEPKMLADTETAEVKLYGQVIRDRREEWKWSKEDKSASDFDKAIKDVLADGAKKLKLRINSPGGVVNEAVAMRSILCDAGFEEINIKIEGMCASAATILATIPGAHVSIAPGSQYMIHRCWTIAIGNANDMQKVIEDLHSLDRQVIEMYEQRTGQEYDTLKEWMDATKWFTAKEAVESGFADEVSKEKQTQAVACVTSDMMAAMRELYASVPDEITVSNEPTPKAASGSSEKYKSQEGGKNQMDIKDITMEQLQSQNPTLCKDIADAAIAEERQRVQDIDDMTIAGYEDMAAKAKADGTSAIDFHKSIVQAQREKGKKHLANRAAEVADACKVSGSDPETNDGADYETQMTALVNDAKAIAESVRNGDGGMY